MNAWCTVLSSQTLHHISFSPRNRPWCVSLISESLCLLFLLVGLTEYSFIRYLLNICMHPWLQDQPLSVSAQVTANSKTQYTWMHANFIFWKWWFEESLASPCLKIRQTAEHITSGRMLAHCVGGHRFNPSTEKKEESWSNESNYFFINNSTLYST